MTSNSTTVPVPRNVCNTQANTCYSKSIRSDTLDVDRILTYRSFERDFSPVFSCARSFFFPPLILYEKSSGI